MAKDKGEKAAEVKNNYPPISSSPHLPIAPSPISQTFPRNSDCQSNIIRVHFPLKVLGDGSKW